jgi:integrase
MGRRKSDVKGVYDRRWNADGSRSPYPMNGALPWIYCMRHPNEPGRKWTYDVSCATEDEAKEGKRLAELEYRNRKNPEFIQRREKEKLREYTVGQLIKELADRLDAGETMCDDRELNRGDMKIYYKLLSRPSFPSSDLNLYDATILEDGQRYFNKFRDERLKDNKTVGGIEQEDTQIKRGTVKAELGLIRKAFEIAKEKDFFDVCHLMVKNPLDGVKVRRADGIRFRVIEPHEEIELAKRFSENYSYVRYYLPLAMYMAIDTCLRQSEITDLLWSDIDFSERLIRIRDSKTDETHYSNRRPDGRWIVMPYNTMQMLIELYHHLTIKGHLPGFTDLVVPDKFNPDINQDAPVFIGREGKKWTQYGLMAAFTRLVQRATSTWGGEVRKEGNTTIRFAGIKKYDKYGYSLVFHCTRKNADRHLWALGLSAEDRDYQRNGNLPSTEKNYTGDRPPPGVTKRIQDALDKYVLKVRTYDANGRVMLDDDGEPELQGLTLNQALRMFHGRKITVEEMIELGRIPLPYLTRLEIAKRSDTPDEMKQPIFWDMETFMKHHPERKWVQTIEDQGFTVDGRLPPPWEYGGKEDYVIDPYPTKPED